MGRHHDYAHGFSVKKQRGMNVSSFQIKLTEYVWAMLKDLLLENEAAVVVNPHKY